MSGLKHGMASRHTRTPTWKSWNNMISRCYRKSDTNYPRYGGIGIFVCEFLRASPVNLLGLIGERPEGLSIDRIDTLGNYTCGQCADCMQNNWPLNVRWSTHLAQSWNRTRHLFIVIQGQKKCLAEWANIYGINPVTANARFRKGIRGEELFHPPRARSHRR